MKSFEPDVLLLDIMMPRLSGFEVCKRLKSDPASKNLPILMITALDQPSDVERAVDAGTDDFLTKPIHQTELINRVRALLAQPQFRRCARAGDHLHRSRRSRRFVRHEHLPRHSEAAPRRPFFGRHPWVFAGAIASIDGSPARR